MLYTLYIVSVYIIHKLYPQLKWYWLSFTVRCPSNQHVPSFPFFCFVFVSTLTLIELINRRTQDVLSSMRWQDISVWCVFLFGPFCHSREWKTIGLRPFVRRSPASESRGDREEFNNHHHVRHRPADSSIRVAKKQKFTNTHAKRISLEVLSLLVDAMLSHTRANVLHAFPSTQVFGFSRWAQCVRNLSLNDLLNSLSVSLSLLSFVFFPSRLSHGWLGFERERESERQK